MYLHLKTSLMYTSICSVGGRNDRRDVHCFGFVPVSLISAQPSVEMIYNPQCSAFVHLWWRTSSFFFFKSMKFILLIYWLSIWFLCIHDVFCVPIFPKHWNFIIVGARRSFCCIMALGAGPPFWFNRIPFDIHPIWSWIRVPRMYFGAIVQRRKC